ncbi:MAG TPA: hypothetical protein VG266_09305 [Candidatus Dormibacteraeota bacterium]|nr:hypothetical protein [Candidatus Dormibacteraeota bacterium]
MSTALVSFAAAFIGSLVESVEALTIVLAVGLTRGWRAPLYGTVAALAALVAAVVGFGTLMSDRVPEKTLKVVVGTLLLLFGLRWLRKAILRAAGVIAMHDEAEEFTETVGRLGAGRSRPRTDWTAFGTAFQGVFLEGVEVAFIVVAVGSSERNLPAAAVGGVVAMAAVAAAGLVVRRPLARIPENTLKYIVGLLLTSLGTFWAAEGAGASWPGDVASLLVLIAFWIAASRLAIVLARSRRSPLRPSGRAA